MRPPQIAGVAKQSSPSWLSASTLNPSGDARNTYVRPCSLVAKTWSPTRTGDDVNPPPSRPVHTCLPVSLFQQVAVPPPLLSADTKTSGPTSVGDDPNPWWETKSHTLTCQSCLPSRSRAVV